MQDVFALARQQLLEPGGLDESALDKALSQLCSSRVDGGDIYFQDTRHESWVLEDGRIREGGFNIERGVGVRAISGERVGLAYSNEIALPAIIEAAHTARAISQGQQSGRVAIAQQTAGHQLYSVDDPLGSLSTEAKLDLLRSIDVEARGLDPRVTQVMVSLSGVHEIILVATTNGELAADVRPLVRLNVHVIVEDAQGRREQAGSGGGGRHGYEFFLEQRRALQYAHEAVRQALLKLEADEAPAGNMTVVLGSGWPGVMLHEAVGHGLEGDFNRKGTSAFSGRIGERVAAPGVTVVDDGTLAGRRGSLNVDDEGVPTACNVLIEDGILKAYMQDRLNARLMKGAPTGNGRRESYAHLPMPRMTNTYMLAGQHAPEDIIASVDKGLYAVNFGGGQVDITSGKFVFSASEAYLIENGKITRPVKGATLIGNGPDALTRVSMVGNDLDLDSGVGTCGKEGQSVPVCVGQPTLRIDGLTVGGTQH
ncbi:microcin-processing peptidase 2. Unknown type peptidase. MEROPS family U62 [Ectothiorhodosinus mongolicus]|uniref:TldD protein n=1 Tax=Ectothiorhodosinus mongolicus TaxID=233100 RepID=A0A1R3VT74_9GAMM|nr:metalloprotease TldD [Ectothiorhodosinus mongolicus]ULX56589.1 metalloprotease TldD [Ectothiorhodosinus mongolicus]SIT66426.1 microcin-processing peptidase 2. Unknown type peptidase. MEROPS family U62 [Ectothiorhodosinus mongolicus]